MVGIVRVGRVMVDVLIVVGITVVLQGTDSVDVNDVVRVVVL